MPIRYIYIFRNYKLIYYKVTKVKNNKSDNFLDPVHNSQLAIPSTAYL